MITGCAPFFLIALAGVALGSWSFGTHLAARITGISLLAVSILYFALLNWTAQNNLRQRKDGREEPGLAPYPEREARERPAGEAAFTASDRKECGRRPARRHSLSVRPVLNRKVRPASLPAPSPTSPESGEAPPGGGSQISASVGLGVSLTRMPSPHPFRRRKASSSVRSSPR